MNRSMPHIVQYQGSKRLLAPQILRYMPQHFDRCVEPFCGTAAVTIAVAGSKDVNSFWINDLNEPLLRMMEQAIEEPEKLYESYKEIWSQQFEMDSKEHFLKIRKLFNEGDKSAGNMLYLLARCVKGAVRYNDRGELNQSCDKRRNGTRPETIRKNMLAVSGLLKGKTRYTSMDYREVFMQTVPGDIVYMDPPYQGTSNVRDNRYLAGVSYEDFSQALTILNDRHVDFLISYDGACGTKTYGKDLPEELGCRKLLLKAGRSTQATLLGRKDVTYEALYVSKGLQHLINELPLQESLWEDVI